jgi:hypothetical protein
MDVGKYICTDTWLLIIGKLTVADNLALGGTCSELRTLLQKACALDTFIVPAGWLQVGCPREIIEPYVPHIRTLILPAKLDPQWTTETEVLALEAFKNLRRLDIRAFRQVGVVRSTPEGWFPCGSWTIDIRNVKQISSLFLLTYTDGIHSLTQLESLHFTTEPLPDCASQTSGLVQCGSNSSGFTKVPYEYSSRFPGKREIIDVSKFPKLTALDVSGYMKHGMKTAYERCLCEPDGEDRGIEFTPNHALRFIEFGEYQNGLCLKDLGELYPNLEKVMINISPANESSHTSLRFYNSLHKWLEYRFPDKKFPLPLRLDLCDPDLIFTKILFSLR